MEQTIIENWQEEFLTDKPIGDSKYFSDVVPEGKISYQTRITFKSEGVKKMNKFGKEQIEFTIEHEGKEKLLGVGVNQFEVLKVIAKAKPIIGKTVEWERTGSTQKDTRRAVKFIN